MTQEQPPPGTHCIVDACSRPATLFVEVTNGENVEGETAVPMCDEHAAHWRSRG
jgi:hypothetical protein